MGSSMLGLRRGRGNKVGKGGGPNKHYEFIYICIFFFSI